MVASPGIFQSELARHVANFLNCLSRQYQYPQPDPFGLTLRLIARLYRWERVWDKRRIGARRAALRQLCYARPLHRLRRLVLALRKRALPKSGLGRACAYLLDHWEPLTAHLRYSETQLDNNLIEKGNQKGSGCGY